MPQSGMTRGELVAIFAMKATAPPPEANKLLVRHLQCKESIRLAGAVRQAMDRFAGVGVESTARQGTGFGFAFVVVEDACSSQDADLHRFAFEKTFPRLARVRKTDEVISALASGVL